MQMDSTVSQKIETFFDAYRLRKYPKGQILILNGDNTDYVYHLVEGRVKQYDVSYRGDEIILNVFKPPAFFPMSLAINKTPNPYIFEAETDVEIRQAPADEVVEFVRSNPDVLFDLLSRVYRGTDGLLGRIAHLMSSSAKGRLMYELLVECRRFGEIAKDGSCSVQVNEKELGARAGLSRETVSREINKLAKEKLVTMQAGKITIGNVDVFESKLGKVI
jgi:CRP/FNR family transcriptional regulator